MKMRPIPVETTNPFAEAALGDQMPGQAGMGDVAAVDTAWNKAVENVQGDGTQGQSNSEADREQHPNQGVPEVDTTAETVVLAETPVDQNIGPTWDRLSMTVASMVAWNLQAETAPDREAELALAELVVDPLLAAEALSGTPGSETTDPAITQAPLDVAMVSGLAKTLQAEEDLSLSSLSRAPGKAQSGPVSPTTESLPQGDGTESMTQAQESGQTVPGAALQIDPDFEKTTTLREGTVAHSPGLEVQAAPTEVRSAQSTMVDVDAQLGTAAANGLPIVSTTPTSTVIPEIPTSLLNGEHAVSNTAQDASSSPRSDGADPLQLIKAVRVRSEANVGPAVNVDMDRLQGLRAALAELDTDLLQRMQSARLGQRDRMGPKTAAKAAHTDVMLGLEQVQVRTARIPDAYVQKQLAGAMAAADSSKSLKLQPNQPVTGHVAAEAGVAEGTGGASGKPAQSSTPTQSTGWTSMSDAMRLSTQMAPGQNGSLEQVSGGDSGALTHTGIVGVDSAQIEADVMRIDQSAQVDAKTIEAMEVPELPVNDASQLDIDIEDPAGHVRLDLSRQANEVAIQLETPSEVLEEYRNMEEDIDAALAEHGLNLDSFDAQAGDDGSGEKSGDEKNIKGDNANPLKAGSAPLEKTGERGRLLNLIV